MLSPKKLEISPVPGNRHIPVLWWCPRLAASSHYLIMICCIYQIAGDKPPPLFSQCETQAASALQLFRAHISTPLNIPVQVQRCWRCNPGERSCDREVLILLFNSAELSSSPHKLISFSLDANLVSSLQGFSPYSTSCPFDSIQVLPCHHPGPSAGRTGCCVATGNCHETSTALGSLTLSIPSTLCCLNFP